MAAEEEATLSLVGHVTAQFNLHGNCATATVDTVNCLTFQVERTTFLLYILTNETNRRCCRCSTASDIKWCCSMISLFLHEPSKVIHHTHQMSDYWGHTE